MDSFGWFLFFSVWTYVLWTFYHVRQNSRWEIIFQLENQIARIKHVIAYQTAFYRDFTQGRESIVHLLSCEMDETTMEDVRRLVGQVNGISASIQALELHAQQHKQLIAKATFWNYPSARKTFERLLLESTVYQIEPNARDDLFGLGPICILVSKNWMFDNFDELDKAAVEWKRLVELDRVCRITAEVHFPRKKLDELLRLCDEHEIPRTWLHVHPLSNSTTSDSVFYEKLNALRTSSPTLFVERLRELRAEEIELEDLIFDLVDHKETIAFARFTPTALDVVLDPQDDPRLAHAQALALEQEFLFLLHAHRDPNELECCVDLIVSVYAKAKRLQEQAQSEMASIDERLTKADTTLEQTNEYGQEAEAMVAKTIATQLSVPAHPFVTAMRNERMRAAVLLTDARRLKDARRVSRACIRLSEFDEACRRAQQYSDQATEICETAIEIKELYTARLPFQDSCLKRMQQALKDFGAETSDLPEVVTPIPTESAMTYVERLEHLRKDRNLWDDQVLRAKALWDGNIYRELCVRDYFRALSHVAEICTRLQQDLRNLGSDVDITLKYDPESLSPESPTEAFVYERMRLYSLVDEWSQTLTNAKFPPNPNHAP